MKSPFPTLISAGLLSLASATGCASTSVAPDRVAAPKASIAAAEEAGAAENPKAALHLKLARDQYERAKHLIHEDEGDRARLMLDRASADAQLALELARADNTRREATDALNSIIELRKQHQMLKAE